MSERLKDFLVDLASDPERMNRYLADAGREIDGAGLSAADKAALLSRDSATLRRTLGASPAHHMTKFTGALAPRPASLPAPAPAAESAPAAEAPPARRKAARKKAKATTKTNQKKATPKRKRKAGTKK